MYRIATLAAILAATQASAATTFTCNGMGDDKGQSVTLTLVSPTQISVDGDLADLDPNYNPRLNVDFARFEYEQGDEGISEVLVQGKLLDDEERGLIKVQWRGEGFSSDSYYCHP